MEVNHVEKEELGKDTLQIICKLEQEKHHEFLKAFIWDATNELN